MKRLQGITFIGSSDIIGTGLSAIFWFYLATLVEPEGYGNIFYFLSISGIASLAASVSTQNVITVFSAKLVKIRSTLYGFSIIATSIAMIIVFLLTDRIDASLLILGYVSFNLASGKFLGERKLKKYALINLIQKGLTPSLGLGFFFIFGIESILTALTLTYVVHIFLVLKETRVRKSEIKEIVSRSKFIIFNYGNNLAGLLGGHVDKIIIGILFGFTLLGNYSLAMQIIVAMMIIPNIIFKYLLTEELHGIKDRKFKKNILIFAFVISAIGFFIVPEIIPQVFPKYIEVIDAIRIMSIAILPTTFSKIQISGLLNQERSHVIFGGSISYFVILIIGIIFLGEILGISGIAISFVLASISQIIGHSALSRKLV